MTDEPVKVNPILLRKCREQVNLSIDEVEQKLNLTTLAKMEQEGRKPTRKQLFELADLYLVGPGLFFLKGDQIPEHSNFQRLIPKYRTLQQEPKRSSHMIRPLSNTSTISEQEPTRSFHMIRLMVKVIYLREFLLDLYEDLEEEIGVFSPPKIQLRSTQDAVEAAPKIRSWLGFGADDKPTLEKWREAIENKGVFVFMTSPYNHWSKTAIEDCRGFAFNYSKLPIIVINDSDSYRAQLFSLMHELGHLLYGGKNVLDSGDGFLDAGWDQDQSLPNQDSEEEKICNRFAAEILVPAAALLQELPAGFAVYSIEEKWKVCKKMAKTFNVSALMISYRMVTLEQITAKDSRKLRLFMNEEYKKKRLASRGGRPRNIPKERLRQYGSIYVRGMLAAYYAQEMTLHKLYQNLSFRTVEDVKKLEELM